MTDRKRTALDWEDLRFFLGLARYKTLSGAARALGVNHATISRRLRSLELMTGEKLVERRPDGYVLTQAGTRILSVASAMEVAAGDLRIGKAKEAPPRLLRINAPPGLSQAFLVKQLALLALRSPEINVDLATNLRSVSLDRRETDIAVRVGPAPDAHLVAREVASIGYGIYGTARLCKAIEHGTEPAFVTVDEANSQLMEAEWVTKHFPRARIAFRANNHVAQATAAQTGVGVVLLPHYVGRTTAGLQLASLKAVPENRQVWLLTRPKDRNDSAIRVAVDFLASAFEAARHLFAAP